MAAVGCIKHATVDLHAPPPWDTPANRHQILDYNRVLRLHRITTEFLLASAAKAQKYGQSSLLYGK